MLCAGRKTSPNTLLYCSLYFLTHWDQRALYLNSSEDRISLNDVLGGMSGLARHITVHEQAQWNCLCCFCYLMCPVSSLQNLSNEQGYSISY